MTKWTTELSVEFVPLPPEKEEAYWATIRCFAEIMFDDLLPKVVPPQTEGRDLEKDNG